jgi:hypothetical protein
MGKSTEKDKLEVPPIGHEESDVNFRAFAWFVVGFVVFAVIMSVGLWALFRGLAHVNENEEKGPATTLVAGGRPGQFPEPQLQTDPPVDMSTMRAEEEQTLSTYAWVDQAHGTVRIPIDQAMKLAVERGIYRVNNGALPAAVPVPAQSPAAVAAASRAKAVTAPGDVAQTTKP